MRLPSLKIATLAESKGLLRFQRFILIVTSVVIAVAMFFEVVLRYAHQSLLGLEDFVIFIVGWLYFVGLSYAAYKRSHFRGEIISVFIKNPQKLELARGLIGFIGVGLMVVMTILAWQYLVWVIVHGETSVTLHISTAYGIGSLGLGFTLATYYFLIEAVEHTRNYFRPGAQLE